MNRLIFSFLLCFLSTGLTYAGSSEDAWYQLVGEKLSKRPEFAFVENDSRLPNVLIYGESISIGYTLRVRENLQGKANVYRLYRNGSHSGNFILYMDKMHAVMRDEKLDNPWDFEWDVIHFNVGLHDLKYLSGRELDKENGVQVSSLDIYKKNLHAIVAYLQKEWPNAKLTFATTTPVPEGAAGRFVGDAKKYNAAALDVLGEYPEITINDLYAFTRPNHPKWWIESGNVHYNETGKNAQGDEVARQLISALMR